MRAERVHAYGAALGFLGDLLAGDPRRGHPVAVFGRAAGALERRMWRDDRFTGAAFTALTTGAAVAAAALAGRAVRRSPVPATALTAACAWSVLGGTSLAREARAVAAALEAGDLEGARARLPHLCGRDPQELDAAGIARAVVESVAENTSDAVVGALVWGAALGPAGFAGFRAVNTLDAMVGHRSPRHLRFGWASARLDDAAGWPGARLTAALAVLAGPHPGDAARTWRRDAAAHPSPNAGPVEAAFAGALRLRLGGTLAYGGRVEHRPVLGRDFPPPAPSDIARAVALSRRVSALALALTVAGRLLAAQGLRGRRASAGGAPPNATDRLTPEDPMRHQPGTAARPPKGAPAWATQGTERPPKLTAAQPTHPGGRPPKTAPTQATQPAGRPPEAAPAQAPQPTARPPKAGPAADRRSPFFTPRRRAPHDRGPAVPTVPNPLRPAPAGRRGTP